MFTLVNREHRETLEAAEYCSVEADFFELHGDAEMKRSRARMAANRYHTLGWTFLNTWPGLTAEFWDKAAREYRRGLSHSRAGWCSNNADFAGRKAEEQRLGREVTYAEWRRLGKARST